MIIDKITGNIKEKLSKLSKHDNIVITSRGDAAIKAVLKLFDNVLIPSEGGWLSYKKLPKNYEEVACDNSKIKLDSLKEKLDQGKLSGVKFGAILYQNPGGYFVEQPMKEIYSLCQKYDCKVIMDVSGAVGTKLCDGRFADFMVCSFGNWKLIDAGKGGFVSCKDKKWLSKLDVEEFNDENVLKVIDEKLNKLDDRINYLLDEKNKIVADLHKSGILHEKEILHEKDIGFVIVIGFSTQKEKENLINYCVRNKQEYTECPRYIRVNKPAISIEVKRKVDV